VPWWQKKIFSERTQYFIMDDPFEIYSGNVKTKEKAMKLIPYSDRDNSDAALSFLNKIAIQKMN
jgi:hypothetical protein